MLAKLLFFLFPLALADSFVGLMPPKIIYSATIRNRLDTPVRCRVIWLTPDEKLEQGPEFIIKDDKSYHVRGKVIDEGSWISAEVINEIHCGNRILKAPFDGVSSPEHDWQFTVTTENIVSVGPNPRKP